MTVTYASSLVLNPVVGGVNYVLTVVVTNGPIATSGVGVYIPLPSTSPAVTWTQTASTATGVTGFTASSSASVADAAVSMPASSSVTYTITGFVSTASGIVGVVFNPVITDPSGAVIITGNRQTGTTYTITQGDASKEVEMSSSSPNVVTLPSGIAAGSTGTVLQYGTGATSVALGAGVTAVGTPNLTIGIQGGVLAWRYVSTVEVEISSDLIGPTAQSVAYAATVTPNCDITDVLNIAAMTAAMTLGTPTGSPVDGQHLLVRFTQDGTGGWPVTHGAGYEFDAAVPAAGDPTAPGAVWERLYRFRSSTSKWRCVATWGVNRAAVAAQTGVSGGAVVFSSSLPVHSAALTGNVTGWSISGTPVSGQEIEITWIQDATGSRTLAGGPGTVKHAGAALTLTTTANRRDVVTYRYDGTNWIEKSRSMNVG